jgi:endonuclease YncB( thermonuclease family)
LNRSITLNRILIFIAAFMLFPAVADATTLTGRIVSIADGDTLTLQVGRQQHALKLVAIDAPERYQAWGDRSQANLSRLVLNQMAVADCSGFDPRSNRLCKLTVNRVDIGLEQVQSGMAWWSRQEAHAQTAEDQSAYSHAELMAKLRRLGLWGDTHPVPPWEFRNER